MDFLQYKINFFEKVNKKRSYLLVAGGRKPDDAWLKHASKNKIIICADKGVSYCRQIDIIPDYLVGDGDSSGDDFAWAEQQGIKLEKHNCDKDFTDLQLALNYLEKQSDIGELIITGIWGGRFDHAYSALFSIVSFWQNKDIPILLADDQESLLLAKYPIKIEFLQFPQVVSLLPLTESSLVTLNGTKWELEKAVIKSNNPYTISNKPLDKEVFFHLQTGCAGFYISYFT